MQNSSNNASSTLLDELPKETWFGLDLYKWEGFWYMPRHLLGAVAAKSNFQARDDDVLLTSSMKTGTTWLKALIPTIMNPKGANDDADDPLLSNHPNDLIPSLEIQVFRENSNPDHPSGMLSPRLFQTHVPYSILSESVKNSTCKIVYIARDPKDAFVSLWHFLNSIVTSKLGKDPWPMDKAFEGFCKGVHAFGPFHDHVLGYWKESLKRPDKILFLRYEDLKKDPKGQLKKLASFLGKPFAKEEEVEKVLWRCSLERLKSLEVNQNGVDPLLGIASKFYFRNGIIGDWKNNIDEEMKEKLDQLTAMKFEGSGLDFGQ